MKQKITVITAVCALGLFLIGLHLTGISPQAALAQSEPPVHSTPQACALLDDAQTRGLMSGAFETKLMIQCGLLSPSARQPSGLLEKIFGPTQTDVLVNDPTTDIGQSTTQSETSIAINPNTGTVCSAYNDSQEYSISSGSFAGFSSSTDGGATFIDHGAFPGGGGGVSFGDPSLVWRQSDGKFYYASLHSNGLGLWRSDDDCATMVYNSMIHTGGGDDKEIMAVDNNPASPYYGRLYVAWTDFAAGAQIYVTYSDNTTTWSTPVAVSAVGADVQGAWPAVDPVTSDVYVAWVRWNPYYTGPINIEIVRSTNGGTSFSGVTNPLTGAVNPYDNIATTHCGRPALNGDIRYLPSPQIAVGPDRALHVVYVYDPDGNGTGDVVNTYYRRSTNQGATWGPEIQLNDDGTLTDQYFPTISVGANNVVVSTWYDRRLDPGGNFMFDYYKSISYDGGVTWGPNIRVSDVSSAVPTLAPNFDPIVATCYHGDYDQQIQHDDYVYIQWSDDRNIQNAHPDPDIWFEKELILAQFGWLEGTVYDANTLAPIPGAYIEAVDGLTFNAVSGSDGFYNMVTAPDTYEVTGTAFGYQPNTITNVTVFLDTITTLDIYLTLAPHFTVDGYVTDFATGWPLYASIDTNSPAGVVWTDPETGYYSISLPEGIAYTFYVEAWVPGYIPAARVVGPLTGDVSEDFALNANLATCVAPGYQKTYAFFDDFESGYANWTGSGLWNPEAEGDTCGSLVAPFPSPSNAVYYGQDGICTFDTGAANSGELTLASPVTLPALGSALEFASYEETECGGDCSYDNRYVEISNDGGTTWYLLGEAAYEDSWYLKSFDLSAYGGDNVLVRFRFDSVDSIGNGYFGWMVDDVGFIDGCVPPPSGGGLVVGNVYNQNSLDPVVGAEVSNDTGEVTVALPTPGDPNVDDAFYTLFSPAGDHIFTATHIPPYSPDVETVSVVDSDTVRQDFFLPAPSIALEPEVLEAWLITGTAVFTHPAGLEISNNDGGSLVFNIVESGGGYLPPMLTLPSDAPVYSEPAPIGPASVRSAAGQRLLSEQIHAPNAWSAGATLPAGDGVVRYGKAQCRGDLGSFYVIGGVDESFTVTANVWRYDATSNTWNPLADIPNPQEGVTAVCYGGYIYVLNGGGTNYFYIYNIALDSWSAGPALPRNVWGAAAGAYDGKVFFIGGDDDFFFGGTSDQVDIYDISTGTWSAGTAMPSAAVTALNAQAGRYLYIVGGWDDTSPTTNVNATQRYDMRANTWATGPTFSSARADGSLTITEEYLYAIGGDADGGGAFDSSALVETLNWAAWPGGTWTDISDPLPSAVTANTGGFCTEAMSIGEVWNVGGSTGAIIGNTDYRVSEGCFSGEIPWLWEEPITGIVPAEASFPVEIMYTALYPDLVTPMPFGTYTATLLVGNNDPVAGVQPIPVTMHIVSAFSDPVASFTSNSPVMFGDPVIFTNTSTEGLPITEYYLWDFGDGQTLQVSNADPVNHNYASPGVYTVTLTAHQAQTGVEDVYSDTVVVTGYIYLPLITKNY